MIRNYIGKVSIDKVGSTCEFEFEIDDEDLPEDPGERAATINKVALEELWESGIIDWGFEEVASKDSPE